MRIFKKIQITVALLSGLLLLANTLIVNAVPDFKYDITKYGALGDGKTLNTRYIQDAIDACSKDGGGIRNVKIRNCDIDSGNWAPIRFKTQPSRSGVVENIVYRNIRIKDAKQAFEFNMEWRMVPPIAPPAKVLPVVRNVRFINVSGNVNSLGIIHGLKDSPITNVKFRKCKLTAQKGLIVDNANDIDYSGLRAEVKAGKIIINK